MELDEEAVLGWGVLRHLTLSMRWIKQRVTGMAPDLEAARALKSVAAG